MNMAGWIIGSVMLAAFAGESDAQTAVDVRLNTGRDNLRGGNTAFIGVTLHNRPPVQEQALGGGFDSWSQTERRVFFPTIFSAGEVTSIAIRHDGNPRPGQWFDTHDTWDLRFLTVKRTEGPVIYDSKFDSARTQFVHSFTGSAPVLTIPLQPRTGEVDLVVQRIRRVPRGFVVRVGNRGAEGTVSQVWCRTLDSANPRQISKRVQFSLGNNRFREETVSWRHTAGVGGIACYADGTNHDGSREAVTANNGTRFIP